MIFIYMMTDNEFIHEILLTNAAGDPRPRSNVTDIKNARNGLPTVRYSISAISSGSNAYKAATSSDMML